MIRRPVSSSNIASVGWEPDQEGSVTGTLEVEFRSGHVYEYEGVPESEYENLLGASSVGRYMAKNITGHFDERLVRRS
jgi:hypothetical protein